MNGRRKIKEEIVEDGGAGQLSKPALLSLVILIASCACPRSDPHLFFLESLLRKLVCSSWHYIIFSQNHPVLSLFLVSLVPCRFLPRHSHCITYCSYPFLSADPIVVLLYNIFHSSLQAVIYHASCYPRSWAQKSSLSVSEHWPITDRATSRSKS
jgi:hypothetical protein